MNYFLCAAALMICSLTVCTAQPPDTLWTRTYDGGHGDDWANRIIATRDGGYLVVGSTDRGNNNMDGWLVKLSADGWVEWQRWYGGPGNDGLTAVLETDNGYYLGGYVNEWNPNSSAAWIARIAEFGDTVWTRNIRLTDSLNIDHTECCLAEQPDGIAVLWSAWFSLWNGPPENRSHLAYFSESGELQEHDPIELPALAQTMTLTNSGGLIVLGLGHYEFSFQPPPCTSFWRSRMLVSQEGNVGLFDIGSGHVCYGGPPPAYCTVCRSGPCIAIVLEDTSLTFVSSLIAVTTIASDSGFVVLRSINLDGYVNARSATSGTTGGAVICGFSGNGTARVIRTHRDGHELWRHEYAAPWSEFNDILATPDGYVLCGSQSRSSGTWNRDFWIVKTQLDTTSILVTNDQQRAPITRDVHLFSYPNPFNPNTTIAFTLDKPEQMKLVVYDLSGREVETLIDKVMPRGEHTMNFDGSALPSGLYFARMQTQSGIAKTVKLALVK